MLEFYREMNQKDLWNFSIRIDGEKIRVALVWKASTIDANHDLCRQISITWTRKSFPMTLHNFQVENISPHAPHLWQCNLPMWFSHLTFIPFLTWISFYRGQKEFLGQNDLTVIQHDTIFFPHFAQNHEKHGIIHAYCCQS